jgi:plastocyanin
VKRTVLGLAFVLAAACTEDDPAADNDANVVNVRILPDTFSPATLTIRAGQTVRWTWSGGTHNVVSGTCDENGFQPDDHFRSGAPTAGGTFEKQFPTAGTFPYYCEEHCQMGMRGEIIVQ